MASDCHVGLALSCQVPNLDCLVHGPGSELGEVLGVEGQRQDEVFVLLESTLQCEILFVVPYFYLGIVGTADHKGLSGVHQNGADEVAMCLEALHLLSRVVIEDSDLKVIRTAQDPVLLGQELHRADGEGRGLQSFDGSLG